MLCFSRNHRPAAVVLQRVHEEREKEIKGRGDLKWIMDGSSPRLNGKGSAAVSLPHSRNYSRLVAVKLMLLVVILLQASWCIKKVMRLELQATARSMARFSPVLQDHLSW